MWTVRQMSRLKINIVSKTIGCDITILVICKQKLVYLILGYKQHQTLIKSVEISLTHEYMTGKTFVWVVECCFMSHHYVESILITLKD